MLIKSLLCGLLFVAAYVLFIVVRRAVKVAKLQRLLSESYAGFIVHLAMNGDWEHGKQYIPGSIKLMYTNFLGKPDTMYIKYKGDGSEEKALKYLIDSYNG